jgi:hypothetical protein
MKLAIQLALLGLGLFTASRAGVAAEAAPAGSHSAAGTLSEGVVWPDSTNAVRFRLYTNASPDAPHLFNTFEIEGFGERLLPAPTGDSLKRLFAASPASASLHSILVNGSGPELAATNSLTLIEQKAGPEWRYVAFDGSAAYRGRLASYRRGLLFVEPDLFVLHDHLVANEPAQFQMVLHAWTNTVLDPIWRDLRLELPHAGLRVAAPSRHVLRVWERAESPVDSLLPGTVTMQLGPTNKLAQLDLLTVFAVYRGGEKKDYVFKLVESNNAVGARVHRGGLPTLVAFKTDPAVARASVTGFGFDGPVGVSVFRPGPKVTEIRR